MTDASDQENQLPDVGDADNDNPFAGPVQDHLLTALVAVVNANPGDAIGVSLLVGGTWLTGRLIDAMSWFNSLAEYIKHAPGTGHFGESIGQIGTMLYGENGLSADAPTGFMHLANARTLTSGGSIPSEGGFVRVRIDLVEAWLIGEFTPNR